MDGETPSHIIRDCPFPILKYVSEDDNKGYDNGRNWKILCIDAEIKCISAKLNTYSVCK